MPIRAYNGSTDYSVIWQFKENGEVLVSTDNGAKGFNLEEASFIIHYDLPYNTLKMEQRIDRCYRLGQENDVLSVAFIDKNNFLGKPWIPMRRKTGRPSPLRRIFCLLPSPRNWPKR